MTRRTENRSKTAKNSYPDKEHALDRTLFWMVMLKLSIIILKTAPLIQGIFVQEYSPLAVHGISEISNIYSKFLGSELIELRKQWDKRNIFLCFVAYV